ncbi:crotonobetainyl-CoA:carnitine CoA-transferase CaiB-like acyl-CoA transferase [Actinocorallia herbida]|uniref:Crotonobetainyl-CoA:carnitine CoA-transferase CaiB-like acyl-CoA transferase n=1 Tax=Actinocorallia herbida TaxID=58109 RepID=A0A3N1CZ13_9ACTN|nr:CoA transferase [Actinocorallia herbida]ROO86505.1 crotonobetainyl-CoA:carnitine CoA-transferase CaiB-like acyl-CoA transferase [Actinocorallia herbida]
MSAGGRPLEGFLVLDFTQVVAGPLAAMILADLGARVIKIEPPQGDAARQLGPNPKRGYLGGMFETYNRDKESIVLNLTDEADRARALELVDRADVLLESSRVGVMDRLGLGAEAMTERNPRLVYASITGYGERGPNAERGGVDMSLQGETGWMSITGEPDGPPTKLGAVPIDVSTGHVAAQGILAALLGRTRHGKGEIVRVSLFDVGCHLHAHDFTDYLMMGWTARRTGNFPAVTAPAGVYETADGSLVLAAYMPHHWKAALAVFDDSRLEDPAFASMRDRVMHRETLVPILQSILKTRPTAEWVARFDAARLTTGEVRDTGQAADSDQFAAAELALEFGGAEGRDVRTLRTPARFASFGPREHARAPQLDGDRDDVLTWLND